MKTSLTTTELREAERKLREQLDSSTETVEELETNTLEPTGDPDGQASDEGEDDATVERDRGVIEVQDTLLYEVQAALDRITAGTYGVCEECEDPIERERLEAVPYARTCAECSRRSEASGAA